MKKAILILCILTGCVAGPETPDSETMAAQAFRAEHEGQTPMSADGPDFCEFYGFYGDMWCDTFCASPDPDCQAANECTQDSDCDENESCIAGDVCLFSCEVGDPSCCSGNTCEPKATETECNADADCESDEVCDPGICLDFCLPEDPGCCTPSVCAPVAATTPVDECLGSSDCADDEVCDPGVCRHDCLPSDEGCCAPNKCEALPSATPPVSNTQNECTRDSDCSEGLTCIPGDICLHWCLAGDPLCCTGNTCQ